MRCIAIAFAAAALAAFFMPGPLRAEKADKLEFCYSLAKMKEAFKIASPRSRQVMALGGEAAKYLEAYNNMGRKTNYKADSLLFIQMVNKAVILIPIKNGVGCNRFYIPPRAHFLLMKRAGMADA